jgi:prepilin-type N-terminal cleavage/methylation domain-containing protein
MKKAFTLVELLIVVVVIVTLMAITFRLAGLGEDQEARNITITRMQRLENALSGYYAAFGTYPPVALHASHNIYLKADSHGTQSADEENKNIWGWSEIGQQSEIEAWQQVEAACRAQPIDCRFPFPDRNGWDETIANFSSGMQQLATDASISQWKLVSEEKRNMFSQGFDGLNSGTLGRFSSYYDCVSWQEIQIFKFGLLSFLLPRYYFMMQGDDSLYERYAQWTANNIRPSDPYTGRKMDWTGSGDSVKELSISERQYDYNRVLNIPSQAICQRWISNFEKSLSCMQDISLWGINLKSEDKFGSGINLNPNSMRENITTVDLFRAGPYNEKSGTPYILDGITMIDGWGQEFYYYSPPPYQGYTVWSSGKNMRTFPPWLDRGELSSDGKRCAAIWSEDDIIHLSN